MVNMGDNAKIPDVLHSLWAKVKKGGLHRPLPAAFQLKPKGFLKFVFFGRVFGLSPVVRGCRPRPQRGTGAPKVASAPRGPMPFRPCGQASSIPAAGVGEGRVGGRINPNLSMSMINRIASVHLIISYEWFPVGFGVE